VLDLRSNPGGLFMASVEIARQWLNEGIIVSTKTREGFPHVKRATGRALTTKPLVVLVNQGTAAAGEILASALRDNKRALLVGEKTFGLGLVQLFRMLSDGSGMTVTIATFKTPSGQAINKLGILPDVVSEFRETDVLKLTLKDIGTPKDVQYRAAEEALSKALR